LSRSIRALVVTCTCSLVAAVAAESAAAGIWTEIPSGTTQRITAIEYQSPTRFWFTTAAGAIYTRRPDGSFAAARAPSGVPLNDIEFQVDGPIGLAVGNGGQVLRSTNHGETWRAITGIPVSRYTGLYGHFIDCTASAPLHDVNAVRFAGPGRAWIFAAGRQIATSQPADAIQVGAATTWRDANRDANDRCKVELDVWESGYADAFFAPFNPDVGYIVASSRDVFLTSNNLATPALLKATSAGRRIAGDPRDPSRMWSSSGDYTRDGWTTDAGWKLGNPNARVYHREGPADVDFADGTVLAAGTAGLILNSVDGEIFYFSSAEGALETQRWTAVGLASATLGAIGGDNGKLATTSQANVVAATTPTPTPRPTPTPTPRPTPRPAPPPPPPVAGRSWTSGTVSGRVLVLRDGRSVALASGRRIPLNTTVDARGGTIEVTVSVNAVTGETQAATLSKGLFRVRQRLRGATATSSIVLRTPPGKRRACAARKPPPKGIVRTLGGTVKGSFTVVGKAATAGVRDATWVLEDTCSGTRVRSVRGNVSVKGRHDRRSITVRPSRSYLVKARLFGAKQRRSGR
jgi:hypothetical protein